MRRAGVEQEVQSPEGLSICGEKAEVECRRVLEEQPDDDDDGCEPIPRDDDESAAAGFYRRLLEAEGGEGGFRPYTLRDYQDGYCERQRLQVQMDRSLGPDREGMSEKVSWKGGCGEKCNRTS